MNANESIPRRLLCCYRSKYLFTPAMRHNEQILRTLHPKWDINFFNHRSALEWINREACEWSDLYASYAADRQREQLFRWLILWRFGGIWVSPHFRLLKALDPLCGVALVLGELSCLTTAEFTARHATAWSPNETNQSLSWLADFCFGASPKHPFVGIVLDLIIERRGYLHGRDVSAEEEEFTTGAGVLNAAWQIYRGLPEFAVSEHVVLTNPCKMLGDYTPAILARDIKRTYFGNFGFLHADLNR